MGKIVTGEEVEEMGLEIGAQLKIVEVPENGKSASGEPDTITGMDEDGFFEVPEGAIIELSETPDTGIHAWNVYTADDISAPFCIEDNTKVEVL